MWVPARQAQGSSAKRFQSEDSRSSASHSTLPFPPMSKMPLRVVVFHRRTLQKRVEAFHLFYISHDIAHRQTGVKLNRVFFPRMGIRKTVPLPVASLDRS